MKKPDYPCLTQRLQFAQDKDHDAPLALAQAA